jgi:cytochrome d ubiquinol oxidase subunit I
VYGKLLTAEAVSPLKTWQVLSTFSLFILIYVSLLGIYAWYVARAVRKGPDDGSGAATSPEPRAPAAPPIPGLAPAS